MARRGKGRGQGKGYKNIMGKDPSVHSQSAKGMKQPQRVTIPLMRVPYARKDTPLEKREYQMGVGQPVGTIKEFEDFFKDSNVKLEVPLTVKEKMKLTKKLKMKDTDKDGVADMLDCQPLNKKKHIDEQVTEIEFDPSVEKEQTRFQKFKGKAEAFALKTGKGAVGLGKKGLKTLQERQKEKKEKVLEEVDHPKFRELKKQEARVQELERQVEKSIDEEEEAELFRELDTERDQLRKVQEEITEVKIEDLSDAQLTTLAIRHKTSDFAIFGSGNPYKDEVLRRINARKLLKKEVDEAEKKKPEGSFFDDLF